MSSTNATALQSFTLDKSLFNPTLYSKIRQTWFGDLPPGATAPPPAQLARIFGVGQTAEQKKAFDDELRTAFHPALASIGPSEYVLPTWTTWDQELTDSPAIAEPFLAEIEAAQKQDTQKGAETALSLVLLLDQIPRNIWRDPAGLKLVYTHYDRLSHALIHSCLKSPQRFSECPLDHESFKGKPLFATWFTLPLLHAEYLPSHDLAAARRETMKRECQERGDVKAVKMIEEGDRFGDEHRLPVERFGRYPHRNEFVGRESSLEEREYLKTADTWGVESKKEGK